MSALLDEFRQALADEIEELKQRGAGTKLTVREGRIASAVGDLYVYRFVLDSVLAGGTVDDSPVEVRVFGRDPVRGHVVAASGFEITIALEQNLGDYVPQATLTLAPYYLLEILSQKLEHTDESVLALGLKVLGHTKPVVARDEEPVHCTCSACARQSPNQGQEAAIRLALGSETCYIWGPPGTGKTFTLGMIVKGLLERGLSVLLVSNTNVAVDRALGESARHFKGAGQYSEGYLLRLGTPQLPEIRDDENLNFEVVVDRRAEEIRKKRTLLEEQLSVLSARKDELAKAMETLRRLAEARQVLSQLSEKLSRLRGEMTRASESIVRLAEAHLAKRADLERARRTPFIMRFLLRADPRRLELQIRELEAERLALEVQLKDFKEQELSLQDEALRAQSDVAEAEEQLEAWGMDPGGIAGENERLNAEEERLKQGISDCNRRIAEVRFETVRAARLVATTLTRAYVMDEVTCRSYDALVCDEASMAPIPMLVMAATLCQKKAVIAGDFRQLAPIATADSKMVERWLRRDVFQEAGIEAAVDKGGDDRMEMLREQFRMHPHISSVVSALSYGNQLVDRVDVDEQRMDAEPGAGLALCLYDTSEVDPWCNRTPSYSRFNIYSAVLAFRLAVRALEAFDEVAIISPYRAQTRILKRIVGDARLEDRISVDSVHRFQGMEKDVVIFDTVDGRGPFKMGRLLKGPLKSSAGRLVNVAMSRAKHKLAIIANLAYMRHRLIETDVLRQALDWVDAHYGTIPSESVVASYFDDDVRRVEEALHWSLEDLRKEGCLQYFTQHTFDDAFRNDVEECAASLVLMSPFVTARRVREWIDLLRRKVSGGMRLLVVTREPERQGANMKEAAREGIGALRKAGAEIEFRPRMHEKMAFLDCRTTWAGSLNILSFAGTSEQMIRIPFARATEELLRLHGFTTAAEDGDGPPAVSANVFPIKRCACGAEMAVIPKSKFGPFYKCASCAKTASLSKPDLEQIESRLAEELPEEMLKCPNTGGRMVLRRGKTGIFLGCEHYPDCRVTRSLIFVKGIGSKP